MNFVIVYIVEPHPHGQICPYTKNFWLNYPANFDIDGQPLYQPNHYEWRFEQAIKMKAALLTNDIPVLVDKMDNPVWCTYGPAPNNAYLIDTNGTVIEKQGWYNPDLMEDAIINYLGDLNGDGVIDVEDYSEFRKTLGKCDGDTGFNSKADYDQDGCVSYLDYRIWYGYYLDYSD